MGKTDLKIANSQVLKLKVSKNRAINLDLTKNARRKRDRNSGAPYISTAGHHIPGKIPTDEIKVCTEKCRNEGCLYSVETKQNIFKEYYSSGDYDLQTTFLLGHVQEDQQNPLNHKRKFRYFLPRGGQKAEVCQETFKDVLNIKRKRIRIIQDKLAQGILLGNDMRGRHENRPHRLDAFTLDLINSHIRAFPTNLSHYKRNEGNNPLQMYLAPGLNLSKMFRLFVDENPNYVRAPFLKSAYESQFKRSGLKFAKLRSDTCNDCERLFIAQVSAETDEELNRIQQETETHHLSADSAYRKMNGDIHIASHPENNTTVLCVDLQQVLFTPTLDNKDVFYLRQYSTYNFCVYDAGNDDATMYVWTESEASRGSEEIISCLWKWIQDNVRPLEDHEYRTLILWSDRCYGQNNNFVTLAFGKLLLARKYYTIVEQKFLVSGHSFLACDRLFALIEKQKKICKAFVPTEWVPIIKASRPSRPFYVRMMQLEDFLAFDDLLEFVPRPNTLMVSRAMWLRMYIEEASVILSKPSHSEDGEFQVHVIRDPFTGGMRISHRAEWQYLWLDETFQLRQRNLHPLPIDRNKFQNLMKMMEFILPQYRPFYINLPHL